MWTYIIGALVAAAAIGAGYSIFRGKKNGESCSNCPNCPGCGSYPDKK